MLNPEWNPNLSDISGDPSEMFQRLSKPLLSQSFFMFGARGTGKSTLVREYLKTQRVWTIDLLLSDEMDRLSRRPQSLREEALAQASFIDWILIDEIQKVPALLDVVHHIMTTKETQHLKFALTGSSARKLKMAGANLLAGRAFHNDLFPLSYQELGEQFDLGKALNWGTLPKIHSLTDDLERQEFLRTYVRNYLKEEVWDERLVQSLDPFRKFVEVAAQASGTIVNFSKLARDCGVDDKTAKKYFEILADTFLGFYLEAYQRSVRAQQVSSAKFYLFDPGVKRAAEGLLNVPVVPKTFAYGRAFEHFILCECMRLNAYLRKDFKFSYLRTKDNVEIDLIIERPGKCPVLVEIKSSQEIAGNDVSALKRFQKDFPGSLSMVWSNDPHPKILDGVEAHPWQEGLKKIFWQP
jgi:predicted AAA+ superfamily ATPase